MARRRGRPTRVLAELAEERFYGCEECWENNALWDLDEVLKPLKLTVRERRRLMKALRCPRCEAQIVDYFYDKVVAYEAEELRHAQKLKRYNMTFRPMLTALHAYLLKYPLLGGSHHAGKVLHKAVHRIRPKTLEAGVWYHARHDRGEVPQIKDFLVRDPITQERRAGRFNTFGQTAYYAAVAPELAAIEMTGTRDRDKRIWIAPVRITKHIRVVDLRIQMLGKDERLPLVLSGLIYSGVVSAFTDNDKSLPQYRVPQYIADLLRSRKIEGVLYTRTRDSGFRNPEAWGENLVMLSPELEHVELVSDPVLYCWQQDDFDLFTSVNLHEVEQPGEALSYVPTHPVLR